MRALGGTEVLSLYADMIGEDVDTAISHGGSKSHTTPLGAAAEVSKRTNTFFGNAKRFMRQETKCAPPLPSGEA